MRAEYFVFSGLSGFRKLRMESIKLGDCLIWLFLGFYILFVDFHFDCGLIDGFGLGLLALGLNGFDRTERRLTSKRCFRSLLRLQAGLCQGSEKDEITMPDTCNPT